jgi:hypothetical protein
MAVLIDSSVFIAVSGAELEGAANGNAMSDDELDDLWRKYLAAERARVGGTSAMDELVTRFVGQVLTRSAPAWHAWALNLAREVVDEGRDVPIRLPLFRQVLLPALAEGIRKERPGCARQLAYFHLLLYHSRAEAQAAGLPPQLGDQVSLLREAVRIHPADARSRRVLIHLYEWDLDFALHELPDYVIANSPERCQELLDLLREFEEQVDLMGQTDTYQELIAEGKRHFPAWRDYLIAGRPGGSYEAYLAGRQEET